MSNVSVNLSVFYLFDSLVTYCSSCSRDLDFRLTVFGLIRIPRLYIRLVRRTGDLSSRPW